MAKRLSQIGGKLVAVSGTLGRADTDADCCCGQSFEECTETDCDPCSSSYTIAFNNDTATLTDPNCGSYDWDTLLDSCFTQLGSVVISQVSGCSFAASAGATTMTTVTDTIDITGSCTTYTVNVDEYEYFYQVTCHPSLGLVLFVQVTFRTQGPFDPGETYLEMVYIGTFFIQSTPETCHDADYEGDDTDSSVEIKYRTSPVGGYTTLTTTPSDAGTFTVT